MTLFKLSLRNARRQARDYLVYFVTIVMAAALVYAFNGLVFSQEIQELSTRMESLTLIIVLTSAAVVAIVGWLVQYTTKFMLERRSREFGTYILIGLENKQVARMFFLENLAVGAVALVLGVLLGNLIFQALRAMTLSLFGVAYAFRFDVSLETVGLTLVYFTLIYLLALFKSHRRIRTMKIHDLIYCDRKNEGEAIHKSRSRRRIFAVSIALGVAGTLLLLTRSLATGLLGAVFLILFLYGFFLSFSSGVPAYFEKRPGRKYTGQTLLIFRTLASKLSTMGVVMATVALLFTGTFLAEGSGLIFQALFESRARETTCFDLYIGTDSLNSERFQAYQAYLGQNIPVRTSYQYEIYQGGDARVTDFVAANTDYVRAFESDLFMRASDYAALRAMLGYPEAALQAGEYYIHCMPYLKGLLARYPGPVSVGGVELAPGGLSTEPFTQSLWDGNGGGFLLVVPDELAEARPVSHYAYAAMTDAPVGEAQMEALNAVRDAMTSPGQDYDTIFAKAEAETESAAQSAMVVFPLYYLALVLTMVSATILTIQQLSESDRYRRQFALLRKLGMDRREMGRSLSRQLAIYYVMPAVPPLFIGVPFILALGGALDPGVLTGPGQLFGIVGVALALFLLVYLIYIVIAYTSMRRNVLPE